MDGLSRALGGSVEPLVAIGDLGAEHRHLGIAILLANARLRKLVPEPLRLKQCALQLAPLPLLAGRVFPAAGCRRW